MSQRHSALTFSGIVAASLAAASVTTGLIPPVEDSAVAPEEITAEIVPIQSQVLVAGVDLQAAAQTLADEGLVRHSLQSRSGRRSARPDIDDAGSGEVGSDETNSRDAALAQRDAVLADDAAPDTGVAPVDDIEPADDADNAVAPEQSVPDAVLAMPAPAVPEVFEPVEHVPLDAAEALAAAGNVLENEAIATEATQDEIREAAERVGELIQQAEDPEAEVSLEELFDATDELTYLTESGEPAAVFAEPAPMTAVDYLSDQIFAAQSDRFRLQSFEHSVSGFPNGRIPASAMTRMSWAPNHMLRADAAAQFERLNVAFRAHFGRNIAITDSYRSFENQVRVRARVPHLAAVPGTSNHGWGIAVDLSGGIQRFGTPEHRWMRENAHFFGWILPDWARENGRKPEPWHWEFHPNQMVLTW